MQVSITKTCDRCEKTESYPVTVEEMNNALTYQSKQKETIERFKRLLQEEVAPEFGPDVLVCLRTGGEYKVMALDNLCEKPEDAKKKKGCKARVQQLVEDIFMLNRKPRKSRKKKEE